MLVDEYCLNIIEHLLPRLHRRGDNRYIWYAEKHGGILNIVGPLVILGTVIDGAYRTMTLDQEE